MIPKTAKEQLLTLDECRSLLLGELGTSTPALVTLKRWSQGGLLGDAKRVPDQGRRVKFSYPHLLARVRELSKSRGASHSPPQHAALVPEHTAASRPTPNHEAGTPLTTSPAFEAGPEIEPRIEEISAKVLTDLGPEMANALRPVLDEVLRPLLLEALATTQKQLVDGLANIRSIERSLMLRFDNENQMLRNKVAELKQENDRLRQQSNSIDTMRLQMTLTRLTEKIDALKGEGS